ncbi:MAG TPA: general stress protein [Gemmataceae bacterium]|nr:general stress protein [Gemmataceae bacterium]
MSPANTGAGSTGPEPVTAVGVFPGYAEARSAVNALRAAGYPDDHIGVVGPGEVHPAGEKRSGLADDPTHTHWEEGAGIGAAVGGLGGLGLGAAVAAGLMSPLGPVVAGGTLIALLASAGGGATVGAAVGALAGAGVPEDEAQWYVDEAAKGRVVVTVRAADGAAARDILARHGGVDQSSPPGPAHETAIPGNALPATPY